MYSSSFTEENGRTKSIGDRRTWDMSPRFELMGTRDANYFVPSKNGMMTWASTVNPSWPPPDKYSPAYEHHKSKWVFNVMTMGRFVRNHRTCTSRQPVLDCGTIFHPDCGGRDFPSIPVDDL